MADWLRRAAFVLVVASVGAHAAAPPVPVPMSMPMDWLPAALAALLVGFLIAGLAYMVGRGFGLPQLINWANAEIWEVCLSGMMVGLVFFIVSVLTSVSIGLTGQVDHFAVATAYLDSVEGTLQATTLYSIAAIQAYAYASTVAAFFFIPIPVLPFPGFCVLWIREGFSGAALLGGLGEALKGMNPIFGMLWGSWFAVWAQRALIMFIKNNILQFIFPLGLIFRAFPLTRRMGGTMIAMSLALLFAFPLSLGLAKTIFDVYPVATNTAGEIAVSAARMLLFELVGMFGGLNVLLLVEVMIPVVQHFVSILVLTVFTLIITVTTFRAIALEVGGDPNIFGSGKLGM